MAAPTIFKQCCHSSLGAYVCPTAGWAYFKSTLTPLSLLLIPGHPIVVSSNANSLWSSNVLYIVHVVCNEKDESLTTFCLPQFPSPLSLCAIPALLGLPATWVRVAWLLQEM